MAAYALVKNGVVENMVLWDGVTEYTPDGELVEVTSDTRVGGSWDGNVFTFVEPTPPEPTADQVTHAESKANAKSKLAALGLSEDEISAAFGI
jgi:hypothetical protein